MMERTAAQTAALAEELRSVMRQAEKLVTALSEDREEALVELRERVSAALVEARKRLAQFEDHARYLKDSAGETLDAAGATVDRYVRENPWTTVGISAALGLILGSWLASDSRE
jgi:ElaB/YqjD/DUF883 family membrane-anchored ribosome-binding protein